MQPATQHVLYALGRGTDSVFVGRGDALIYASDAFPLWGGEEAVEPHDGSNEMRGVDAAVEATLSFARQLAARGISLLVLPIPPGITLHPERLGGAPGGVPLEAPSDLLLLMHLPTTERERTESATAFIPSLRGAGVVLSEKANVLVIGDSFNDGLLAQSIGCSLGGAVDRITVSGGGASVVRQIVATRPERLSGKALV